MTSLNFQGVLWGNSDKAVCYHEIACTLSRISTLMTDGLFLSQNQGDFASMDFPVNFDALIYIF